MGQGWKNTNMQIISYFGEITQHRKTRIRRFGCKLKMEVCRDVWLLILLVKILLEIRGCVGWLWGVKLSKVTRKRQKYSFIRVQCAKFWESLYPQWVLVGLGWKNTNIQIISCFEEFTQHRKAIIRRFGCELWMFAGIFCCWFCLSKSWIETRGCIGWLWGVNLTKIT